MDQARSLIGAGFGIRGFGTDSAAVGHGRENFTAVIKAVENSGLGEKANDGKTHSG